MDINTFSLLLIFSFLGGPNVPKTILIRGRSPRRRWDESGEIKETTAVEAGLDPDLFAFLSNELALNQAINILASHSPLEVNTHTDNQQTFTLDPHLLRNITQQLPQAEKAKWSPQACVLTCQALFRGRSLGDM